MASSQDIVGIGGSGVSCIESVRGGGDGDGGGGGGSDGYGDGGGGSASNGDSDGGGGGGGDGSAGIRINLSLLGRSSRGAQPAKSLHDESGQLPLPSSVEMHSVPREVLPLLSVHT
ncbi:ctenidin-3-like [Homalodisca vitripennis]|uniref:ctenidin-3-like n=1 Tax=Homalodisca vitripennis TaxID=197043 RepID=UPI001EEC05B2|nr:ctenidin-3-like [Homalodisca vitripennis]